MNLIKAIQLCRATYILFSSKFGATVVNYVHSRAIIRLALGELMSRGSVALVMIDCNRREGMKKIDVIQKSTNFNMTRSIKILQTNAEKQVRYR